jgi:N-glycosylase/DNA lyase
MIIDDISYTHFRTLVSYKLHTVCSFKTYDYICIVINSLDDMTVATLNKYRTYLTDSSGKPVMVQLDLRNKRIKKAYEKIMNELEAEATFEMINEIKNDPNNTWSDFFEVTSRVLTDKTTKSHV